MAEIKKRYVGIHGSQKVHYVNSIESSDFADTATYTFGGAVPAGCILEGISTENLKAITGATSFTIGDGSTADLYGTGIAVAKGTKTGSANYKSGSTMPIFKAAAGNIVLTGTGGNLVTGKVRLDVHYYKVFI